MMRQLLHRRASRIKIQGRTIIQNIKHCSTLG
jgi:hypothetical protein